MVNRGPQLVQLMNGYPNRRSAGSASSARQSSQVALSAETSARRRPVWSLAAIANPAAPVGTIAAAVTRSTRASGGACVSSSPRNCSTHAAAPSTSAKTPSTSLPTHPARPSRVAREYTKGRKPTPCTTPSTRTDARTMVLTSSPPWVAGVPSVPLMRHLGGFLLHWGLPPQAVVLGLLHRRLASPPARRRGRSVRR